MWYIYFLNSNNRQYGVYRFMDRTILNQNPWESLHTASLLLLQRRYEVNYNVLSKGVLLSKQFREYEHANL